MKQKLKESDQFIRHGNNQYLIRQAGTEFVYHYLFRVGPTHRLF
jgi:hypothetical protein